MKFKAKKAENVATTAGVDSSFGAIAPWKEAKTQCW